MLTRDIDIAILSICLSVTSRYCTETVCHIVTLSSVRFNRSSFLSTKHLSEIPTGSSTQGRRIQVGYINFATFSQIGQMFLLVKTISPVIAHTEVLWIPPWKFSVFAVCALLTRDLFAMAKFLVVQPLARLKNRQMINKTTTFYITWHF